MVNRKDKKMAKDISHQGYPKIVAVIGAKYGQRTNYMTAAWTTYLSHDPLLFGVSIAPQRFTHDLIKKSGEFNCNFLPFSKTEIIHAIGRKSGERIDKIKELDLATEEGRSIETPYLNEAYAIIECKLHKSVKAGDHTFFMGEILNAFGDNQVFTGEGTIDLNEVEPALYIGNNRYATTKPEIKIEK